MAEPKPCKFNCGTMIEWRGQYPNGKPYEVDSGSPHTPERCKEVKASRGVQSSGGSTAISEKLDKVVNAVAAMQVDIHNIRDYIMKSQENFKQAGSLDQYPEDQEEQDENE